MTKKAIYYFNKMAIYLYCVICIVCKRRQKQARSKEILVIIVSHMGECIMFTDCLREMRRHFSRAKGYHLRFYGNSSSVNYYKEFLRCELDEYVAIDTDFGLEGKNPRLKNLILLCQYISQCTPEQIVIPFPSFFAYLIPAIVQSDIQWSLVKESERTKQNRIMQYIISHSIKHVSLWYEDESLFDGYARMLKAIGVNSYQSKIGRIKAGEIKDTSIRKMLACNYEYCVIVPGSMATWTRWESEKYIEVIRYIRNTYDLACIITGVKDEELIGEKIKREFIFDEEVQTIVGKTNLHDLLAVIEGCRFVVGNDTGTAHMAVALGKKYIVLLAYKNIGEYFPYSMDFLWEDDKMPVIVTLPQKPYCAHCHIKPNVPKHKRICTNETCMENVLAGKPCLCLSEITVDQVCKAIELEMECL